MQLCDKLVFVTNGFVYLPSEGRGAIFSSFFATRIYWSVFNKGVLNGCECEYSANVVIMVAWLIDCGWIRRGMKLEMRATGDWQMLSKV